MLADLIGLAAGKTRDAQRAVETESLVDFAVDPARPRVTRKKMRE